MAFSNPNLDKFDHIIVLMMENRSFDNLLGYAYENDAPKQFFGRGEPAFRGVAGRDDLWNPDDQNPPNKIFVAKAPYDTPDDMCHPCPDPGEFYQPHINRQVYGVDIVSPDITQLPVPAPMIGFVQDYIRAMQSAQKVDAIPPTIDDYRIIMNCFPPEAIPVTSGLARAFAVSDEWFCSVPSQTFCNRSFFHSAQSHGFVNNADYVKWILHNRAPTIFERLGDSLGADNGWRIYWDQQDLFPLTRLLHPALDDSKYDANFRHMDSFAADCASGDLPAYTFIQPRLLLNHNDMHPPIPLNVMVHSSILAGEILINDVYNAVRNGKNWLRTLLVVTFDEHGGCYDHWPPPLPAASPVPNPPYSFEEDFRFDRFGVRVPTIFISPYVAESTVVRAPGVMPFDHTSMIQTICQKWGLSGLTARDQAAPDFLEVLSLPVDQPRITTPAFQPRPYQWIPAEVSHDAPISLLQRAVLEMVAHKAGVDVSGVEKLGEALDVVRQSGAL